MIEYQATRPPSVMAEHGGSADDTEAEVRGVRDVGQAQAFESDVPTARVVEEPDTVAEQHRRDAHEDLVDHAFVEALAADVGTDDVDVPVARGRRGLGDGGGEVTHEGDARHGPVRGVVGEDEL